MSAGATAVPALEPVGYETVRERGASIVALPSVIGTVRDAIADAGTLYQWAASQADARAFTGRGAAYGVTTSHGEWVVRHYRRGGAVARILDDRYARGGEPRPLRELRASTAARGRGVPTPEVVAAVVYRAGPMYRGDLATRYIPDSADLAEAALGPRRLAAPQRLEAWRAAGRLLRVAFAAGVEHRDLNLRNILIQLTAGSVTAFLLDLDRAAVHETETGDAVRRRMLERLHRSRRKLESGFGTTTAEAELHAFSDGLEHG